MAFNGTIILITRAHNIHYTIGLRFITNQRSPVPLLAADSDQEEDSESYEMESMSHFGKGWRWTTTL